MDLIFQKPQKRVTTTLDQDDYDYCKKKNIKFAHLIRAGVRDHKVHTEDPDAEPSLRQMRSDLKRLRKSQIKLFEAIKEELGDEGYVNFVKKL